MYARILEFVPKLEKREEFIKVIDDEVLPILEKQNGFLDALVLFQIHSEKAIAISLWTERTYAEPYEREWFPKVREILKSYLTVPIIVKHYVDETTLGGHFEKTHWLPECISTEESAESRVSCLRVALVSDTNEVPIACNCRNQVSTQNPSMSAIGSITTTMLR